MLHLDFETRSQCDLKKEGVYRYATDPTTQVIMLGYAIGDDPVKVWVPGEKFPKDVAEYLAGDGPIKAWNATFERLIWNYVMVEDHGAPKLPLYRWQCTAAQARARALPGALENCARALGLDVQKGKEGARLIRTYCTPGHPDVIPASDMELFKQYCIQDVVVERAIGQFLPPLEEEEWGQYIDNEYLNDSGIPVDANLCRRASNYGLRTIEEVDEKIRTLTHGYVDRAKARTARDEWLFPRLTEYQTELVTVYRKGKKTHSLDEDKRNALLDEPDLDPEVRELLELLNEAGGSTIAKYRTITNWEIEGKVYGALLWNGAGQTGRYASRGIQLHNLRRDVPDNAQDIINAVACGDVLPDCVNALASIVRCSVTHPDGIGWVDWSAIEGRVLPWLAKSALAERKLDLFRAGEDLYAHAARGIFSVQEVTPDQRQAGKVAELALGFAGGVGALASMGKNYGMTFTQAEGERIRDGWRASNRWAMVFWNQLADAAIMAMRKPRTPFAAGRVTYWYDGKYFLLCLLPSGRAIYYPDATLEPVTTPWGEKQVGVTHLWGARKPKVGEDWPRRHLHSGIAAENVTQAVAADLLREAVTKALDNGVPVILHCHDEIVQIGQDTDRLAEIMVTPPAWADGLPLAVKASSGKRYGK